MTVSHAPQADTQQKPLPPMTHGLIAAFDDVDAVVLAARKVRDAGYKHWDVHSPFPIHGIDPAMGIRSTMLPWIVLLCGLTGMVSGLFLTIWTMSTSIDLPESLVGYPYLISGKPLNSLPAFIPVVFEMTILFAAFGAVFGMFLLNGLPKLSHPLLEHPGFERATSDRFFVVIEARDAQYDEQATRVLLEEAGPLSIEVVEDRYGTMDV